MIDQLDELSLRRLAQYRADAIAMTTRLLQERLGESTATALASPMARAAIEQYIDAAIGLMAAGAAFSFPDMNTTQPLVDATLAFRDAQLAYVMALEVVVRDASGVTAH
jgi:hypothetical protein